MNKFNYVTNYKTMPPNRFLKGLSLVCPIWTDRMIHTNWDEYYETYRPGAIHFNYEAFALLNKNFPHHLAARSKNFFLKNAPEGLRFFSYVLHSKFFGGSTYYELVLPRDWMTIVAIAMSYDVDNPERELIEVRAELWRYMFIQLDMLKD